MNKDWRIWKTGEHMHRKRRTTYQKGIKSVKAGSENKVLQNQTNLEQFFPSTALFFTALIQKSAEFYTLGQIKSGDAFEDHQTRLSDL